MRTSRTHLFLAIAWLLIPFFTSAETDVQFSLTDPQFGISQTTNILVNLQAETLGLNNTVQLLPYRLSQFTDTNGMTTFYNLNGSAISGFYHVTVPANSNPQGNGPAQSWQGDIWVQSTNLGLVSASLIFNNFGSATIPQAGAAWTAAASDLRYSQSTNSLANYVQIGALNNASNVLQLQITAATNQFISFANTNLQNISATATNAILAMIGGGTIQQYTTTNAFIYGTNSIATNAYLNSLAFLFSAMQFTLANSNTVTTNALSNLQLTNNAIVNALIASNATQAANLITTSNALANGVFQSGSIALSNAVVNGINTNNYLPGQNMTATTNFFGSIITFNATNQGPFITNQLVQWSGLQPSAFLGTNLLPGLTNSFLTAAATNGLPTLQQVTNVANAVYSNNPSAYLFPSATNGMATTNYLNTLYDTNGAAKAAIAAIPYQPTNNYLTLASVTGINTNNYVQGQNFTITTNISGSIQFLNATNQTFLTNHILDAFATTNQNNIWYDTNGAASAAAFSALKIATNSFDTNGAALSVYLSNPSNYLIPSATNGLILGSIASNSFDAIGTAFGFWQQSLTNNSPNNVTNFGQWSFQNNQTVFGGGSIFAQNYQLLLWSSADDQYFSILAKDGLEIGADLTVDGSISGVGSGLTGLTVNSNEISGQINIGQVYGAITNVPAVNQFQLTTNGLAQGFFGLGSKTNWLITTNVIDIYGVPGLPVIGAYVGLPLGTVWTNVDNPAESIQYAAPNFFLFTNYGNVLLYQSSSLTNWVTAGFGVAPPPIGAYGSQWRIGGIINGYLNSTDLTAQIARYVATNSGSGGGGSTNYSTNFLLGANASSVVGGFTTNNLFTTSGTNAIDAEITRLGVNPTNGITAATATNIVTGMTNGVATLQAVTNYVTVITNIVTSQYDFAIANATNGFVSTVDLQTSKWSANTNLSNISGTATNVITSIAIAASGGMGTNILIANAPSISVTNLSILGNGPNNGEIIFPNGDIITEQSFANVNAANDSGLYLGVGNGQLYQESFSFVSGASNDIAGSSGNHIYGAAVVGGVGQTVGNTTANGSGAYCLIAGGVGNRIWDGQYSSIIGGYSNQMAGAFWALNGIIAGGYSNILESSAFEKTNNSSFVAGYQADSENTHTFVWNDGALGRFSTVNSNTVIFHTANGFSINTNNPNGNTLEVNGGNLNVDNGSITINGQDISSASSSLTLSNLFLFGTNYISGTWFFSSNSTASGIIVTPNSGAIGVYLGLYLPATNNNSYYTNQNGMQYVTPSAPESYQVGSYLLTSNFNSKTFPYYVFPYPLGQSWKGQNGATNGSVNVVYSNLISSQVSMAINTNSSFGQTLYVNGPETVNDKLTVNYGSASLASNLLSPSSISFPLTGAFWTNNTGRNIFVFINNNGVTGTTVSINGTAVFSSLSSDVTVPLQPGEYFSESYTIGSPTALIKPQ